MSLQNQNTDEITGLLVARVHHLNQRVASVLNVNLELQNENDQLSVDRPNSEMGDAYRKLEELHAKYDELQSENRRLKAALEISKTENKELHADTNRLKSLLGEAAIERFNIQEEKDHLETVLNRIDRAGGEMLGYLETLALQIEQLKERLIDQRILIGALIRLQVRQRLERPTNGQARSSNSGHRTQRTSGRFVPAP